MHAAIPLCVDRVVGFAAARAPLEGVERRRAAEGEKCHLHEARAALEAAEEAGGHVLGLLEAILLEASAAIHQDDEVQLRIALQDGPVVLLDHLHTYIGVALLEDQSCLRIRLWACAVSSCIDLHAPPALAVARVARLRARGPGPPLAEHAVRVAAADVARHGLLRLWAILAIVLRRHLLLPYPRPHAAAAPRGARRPLAPDADFAIDGAVLQVAILLLDHGGAVCAVLSVREYGPRPLLRSALAILGALAIGPFRNFAIRDLDLPTLRPEQLGAELFQAAGLPQQAIDVVAALLQLPVVLLDVLQTSSVGVAFCACGVLDLLCGHRQLSLLFTQLHSQSANRLHQV
mmetsp:Transcript_118794/g.296216  ORF Transcript_118794/g.296216 Transcript_118794/m.296216 type:complete len:347 (+) Transcript_118794:466-1506(+)